jgi:hypothetical protein
MENLLADVHTCLTFNFSSAVRAFHPNCQHLVSSRMSLGVTLYIPRRVSTSCFRNLIIVIFIKYFLMLIYLYNECSVTYSHISKYSFANGVLRTVKLCK